jgi:hypothetical protein
VKGQSKLQGEKLRTREESNKITGGKRKGTVKGKCKAVNKKQRERKVSEVRKR